LLLLLLSMLGRLLLGLLLLKRVLEEGGVEIHLPDHG